MENNEAKSFNGKDFVLGSIIGALGGALTALLLAPKTGTELRSDLNSGTVELKHRASDWKDKAYVKGSEWKETAVDKGSEWKDKAYVKGSEWKEKANDSTTRLVQKAQKLSPVQDTETGGDGQSESAAANDIADQ